MRKRFLIGFLILLCSLHQTTAEAGESLSITQINDLYYTGKVWGFLKYYSPEVAKGKIDWDSVLVLSIRKIMTGNPADGIRNEVLADLLAQAKVSTRPDKKLKQIDSNFLWIANTKELGDSISAVLTQLYMHPKKLKKNYYVTCKSSEDYMYFCHENRYKQFGLPPAEYRILGLFRYWNIVQYFYPYRSMVQDWDKVLFEFIPKMARADSKYMYGLTISQLSANIEDSHGELGYSGFNDAVFKKYYWTFEVGMIDDKIIVTDVFSNDAGSNLKPGDEIVQMPGRPSPAFYLDSFRKYIRLSNKSYTDYNLAEMYAMSADDSLPVIKIRRGNEVMDVTQKFLPIQKWWAASDGYFHGWSNATKIIDDSIGYINLSKIRMSQVDSAFKAMKHTKALIFDMRGYPNTPWNPDKMMTHLLKLRRTYVQEWTPDFSRPGRFSYTTYKTGPHFRLTKPYQGKIIVLVNERTKSAAEYVTMMLQSTGETITIGSQTAGSDGVASSIIMPGIAFITLTESGLQYPDGTPTQRKGVKINYVVRPTIEGLSRGKDEVLEYAIKLAQ